MLIASTAKAGVGLNIQDRMCALHHMDAPWRPADVTQREGRLVRQGNQFDQVEIFRYAAIGTFDAFSWQVLERKQSFIEQLCSLRPGQRRITDLDADIRASFRNVKAIASGDVRLIREIELEEKVREMTRSQAAHAKAAARARGRIESRREDIGRYRAQLGILDELATRRPGRVRCRCRRPRCSATADGERDRRPCRRRAAHNLVARAITTRDRVPDRPPSTAHRSLRGATSGDYAVVALGAPIAAANRLQPARARQGDDGPAACANLLSKRREDLRTLSAAGWRTLTPTSRSSPRNPNANGRTPTSSLS